MSDVIISKEALLKGTLPETTFEIPDVGAVRIRGLSRAEVVAWIEQQDFETREVYALAAGMVEPMLSEGDVREWRCHVGSQVIKSVADEILRLSGLLEPQKAVQEAKQSFQEEHGS